MRHGSENDGKLVALQREIARRCARGALRAGILKVRVSSTDRMFIRRPDILWLPLRRLVCEYLTTRRAEQTRLCRDLYTDFRKLPFPKGG